MKYKDIIRFCDRSDRGVNYDITIQEIVEILLIIQTFIFLTKYQQFHYVNEIDLERSIFQFYFNFTLKSSLPLLSNRLVFQ